MQSFAPLENLRSAQAQSAVGRGGSAATNIQAAPRPPLSWGPPTMAVLPLADIATEVPWRAGPIIPDPTSFTASRVGTVKIHAAPTFTLSPGAPTMAVIPSEDNATEEPCRACPTDCVLKSIPGCGLQTVPL